MIIGNGNIAKVLKDGTSDNRERDINAMRNIFSNIIEGKISTKEDYFPDQLVSDFYRQIKYQI